MQFAFEEAKHTQVFRIWLDAVGMTDDLHHYLDDLPAYRQMFYEELLKSLDSVDPTEAFTRRPDSASVTYNHVIEGMMALTGYYAWQRICVDAAFFPVCRNWYAASVTTSGVTWPGAPSPVGATSPQTTELEDIRVTDERTDSVGAAEHRRHLRPLRRESVQPRRRVSYSDTRPIRGCDDSARSVAPSGRPLEDIDVDYSPLQLEDTFADEDQKALAASA